MRNSLQGGTVAKVARLTNSTNGNPRYAITMRTGETFRTAADHGFVYGIDMHALSGAYVLLTIGGRGTVTDLQVRA